MATRDKFWWLVAVQNADPLVNEFTKFGYLNKEDAEYYCNAFNKALAPSCDFHYEVAQRET